MYSKFNKKRFAPVKEGEELNIKIEAVGEKGDGIAKVKGFVIFVPHTKEGQEVRVRITKVLNKVGFAEVVGEKGSSESEESEEESDNEEESEGPDSSGESEEPEDVEYESLEDSEGEGNKDSENFGDEDQ